MSVARYAQIAQNNKFAMFLQYLKKEMNDEVDFLHADKHESFLKLILWCWWGSSSIPNVPRIASSPWVHKISKKKQEMQLIFCMQPNIKFSYKLISTLWASRFLVRWYYHYWWTWSSILKVLKVTSFQYPYNISKKKSYEWSSFSACR